MMLTTAQAKRWEKLPGFAELGPRKLLPFEEARVFVRALRLKNSQAWFAYRSENRPTNIPANPSVVYADKGWVDFPDWLGCDNNRCLHARPFKQARAFVRSLRLKTNTEWMAYCKSGKKPQDIPSAPEHKYKDSGWQGLGDWLGNGTISPKDRVYRPFRQARAYIRSLGFTGQLDWNAYRKSASYPVDIPSAPNMTYAGKGWVNWGDWLGTGNIGNGQRVFRPFKQARAFARSLHLPAANAWSAYSKSSKRPQDIPSAPWQVYAGKGWVSWGDWLGTGTIAPRLQVFVPFKKARAHVRTLGLKTLAEWQNYAKSSKRPQKIPSHPDAIYKNRGWAGYNDWLGTTPRRIK